MANLSPEVEEPLSLIHNLSREPSPIRSQTESQRLQSSSPRALIPDVDKSLVSSTLNSLRIPSIVSQHLVRNQIKSPKIHHPEEDTRTENAQLSQSSLQSFRPSPPPISPHRRVDRGSTVTLQSPQKTASPQRSRLTTSSPQTIKQDSVELSRKSLKSFGSAENHKSSKNPSIISKNLEETIVEAITDLEPQGMSIREHIDELTQSVDKVTKSLEDPHSPIVTKNIEKIAKMSELLKNEANALRESIRSLSADIAQTKIELMPPKEDDVNFPYHLFLVEIVVNKIHMKCECFDIDFNNLVISAAFLGKPPILLYDQSYGEIENFSKLNVGKSTLFAMTYDKICSIKEFEIILQLTKQPPCSSCVTKIGETIMDYTKEFYTLREELCRKWMEEQPEDSIVCTTSTPLSKNLYYLSCGDKEHQESIGVIEVSVRMSFLGKEITTTFCASPRPQGTSFLLKKDNGMTMYSCQKVEMDDQGKILLDESSLTKKEVHRKSYPLPPEKTLSPTSQMSSLVSSKRSYLPPTSNYNRAGLGEFRIRDLNDEINKLMREKRHWEVQIKSLGGPDHARVGPKMLDQDGKEVPGNRGYKYFGAAKDLPGVRELFEQEPPPPPRRTRADLMRDVDADYYGYRDDDDGLLLPLEKEAEKQSIARAVEEWKRNKEQNKDQDVAEEEDIYPEDPDDKRIEDDDGELGRPLVTSHVAVPSQKDIEEALLRRKKQELLEKYGCLDVKMEES